MPLSQAMVDAETGHQLAIWAAKKNLLFSKRIAPNDCNILVSILQRKKLLHTYIKYLLLG